jgi:hypothetical protein
LVWNCGQIVSSITASLHFDGALNVDLTERGGDRADYLTNQTIQVGVCWSVNVKVTTADIVDSLVVNHECAVGVLECCMGCQDGVVRLNNSCGDLKKYRVNIISYQPRDNRLKMFFKTGHTAVAMSDTQKSLMFYIKRKE